MPIDLPETTLNELSQLVRRNGSKWVAEEIHQMWVREAQRAMEAVPSPQGAPIREFPHHGLSKEVIHEIGATGETNLQRLRRVDTEELVGLINLLAHRLDHEFRSDDVFAMLEAEGIDTTYTSIASVGRYLSGRLKWRKIQEKPYGIYVPHSGIAVQSYPETAPSPLRKSEWKLLSSRLAAQQHHPSSTTSLSELFKVVATRFAERVALMGYPKLPDGEFVTDEEYAVLRCAAEQKTPFHAKQIADKLGTDDVARVGRVLSRRLLWSSSLDRGKTHSKLYLPAKIEISEE